MTLNAEVVLARELAIRRFIAWWRSPASDPDMETELRRYCYYRIEPIPLLGADAVAAVKSAASSSGWAREVTLEHTESDSLFVAEGLCPAVGLPATKTWTFKFAQGRLRAVTESYAITPVASGDADFMVGTARSLK